MNKEYVKEKVQTKVNQLNYLVDQLLGNQKHVMMIGDRFEQGRAIEVCSSITFLEELLLDLDEE